MDADFICARLRPNSFETGLLKSPGCAMILSLLHLLAFVDISKDVL